MSAKRGGKNPWVERRVTPPLRYRRATYDADFARHVALLKANGEFPLGDDGGGVPLIPRGRDQMLPSEAAPFNARELRASVAKDDDAAETPHGS